MHCKLFFVFILAVHSLAKITYFSAESWRDMDDWIQCIKQSSRINVSQHSTNNSATSSYSCVYTAVI